jgi:hypothetical protein
MNPRVDAVNRTILTLLGLLLLAGGGSGIAAGVGAFPGPADPPLLSSMMRHFAATTPWFWWVTAGVSLIVAVLGLLWLLAQLRSDRARRLDLTTDPHDGITSLRASALTTAVTDEAERLRGVTRATASLRQRRGHRLTLLVDLAQYADIATVRDGLEHAVAAHARQALEDPQLPLDIMLRPGRRTRGSGRRLQ